METQLMPHGLTKLQDSTICTTLELWAGPQIGMVFWSEKKKRWQFNNRYFWNVCITLHEDEQGTYLFVHITGHWPRPLSDLGIQLATETGLRVVTRDDEGERVYTPQTHLLHPFEEWLIAFFKSLRLRIKGGQDAPV